MRDVATYNVSLQGSGAYNTTGTEVDPSGVIIVGANPVKTKGYTASGGETSITFADTNEGAAPSETGMTSSYDTVNVEKFSGLQRLAPWMIGVSTIHVLRG